MAQDLVSLDTATPQLEVPPTGETYRAPRAVAIAPETLTGSTATPALDIAQTWNTTGTPTGLRLSVTDTASAAGSNLLELRGGAAGTTSLFSVRRDGLFTAGTMVSSGQQMVYDGNYLVLTRSTSVNPSFSISATSDYLFRMASPAALAWTSGGANLAADLFLYRDAANTFAQRNALNGQTYRLYGRYTDGSNYERLSFQVPTTSGTTALIGTEHQGAGFAARALGFQTNGSTRFTLGTDGAATFTGSLTSGPATFNGASSTIASFQDISTGSIFTVNNSAATALLDVTDVTSGNLLSVVNAGGTTVFNVTDAGTVTSLGALTAGSLTTANGLISNSLQAYVSLNNNGYYACRSAGMSFRGASDSQLSFSSGSDGVANIDTILLRDGAAGTLAQRNGTNAQTFRIYNTYTDASNYERFEFAWVSNAMELTMAKLGSGAVRDVRFVLNSALAISTSSAANNIAYIGGTSVGLASSIRLSWTNSTNAGSGSDTGIRRAAAAVVQLDDGQSSAGGGALQLIEMTAPAAPATNNVRIYAEDNGSGKTRLMALFATGVAQQIAIEP